MSEVLKGDTVWLVGTLYESQRITPVFMDIDKYNRTFSWEVLHDA